MKRIAELRKKKKISQGKFAEFLSVARSTVSMWEHDQSEPDSEMLKRIASFFGTTVDYIIGNDSEANRNTWINVLGNVAAGIPIEAIEDIVDQEEISNEMAEQGEYFGLRLRGNSMEPRMHEGDVVIVRRQSDAESGDICVVLVNGDSATVKKIKKRPEGLMLIPNNPSFEAMFYSNEEIARLPVVILGKVIELRAKF